MKLEDKVCTLEQAKKFREFGLFLETEVKWFVDKNFCSEKAYVADCMDEGYESDWDEERVAVYDAPDVAELGVLLPPLLQTDDKDVFFYCEQTIGKRCICGYALLDNYIGSWKAETEAQARASALIYLIENNFIKVEDLKL